MQPCAGKSDIRIPSLKTVKRNVEKELKLAKAIIHELLVTGFVILRTGRQNAKKSKLHIDKPCHLVLSFEYMVVIV